MNIFENLQSLEIGTSTENVDFVSIDVELATKISRLPNLKELALSRNSLTMEPLKLLCNLKNLSVLQITQQKPYSNTTGITDREAATIVEHYSKRPLAYLSLSTLRIMQVPDSSQGRVRPVSLRCSTSSHWMCTTVMEWGSADSANCSV